ncbi:D-erythronate dehydrogenase [Zobellella maritima]|uniref:D-erythronate dehydrogenase n=1 Tax=Zobellella maritima TaxID=2059725 RepID=UPI000E302991|nr:D-erythronate dehydrogenase [Zobellella maritima]
MNIIITGGAGFLGQRLARSLLAQEQIKFSSLTLADVILPTAPLADPRVRCVQADLGNQAEVQALVSAETGLIYHLAAIVSSHAEADFDLGIKVNIDATRYLLEAARHQVPGCRFVFSSSLAVFGGELPELIQDNTAVCPQSSYGMEKAVCELMVNDYARKGFIDGRVLRLPTISVRPGKPNKAASSFASGIIREPLQGEETVCPVALSLPMWLSSPATVIENFVRAALVPAEAFGDSRTVNLPGITVTVEQMIASLARVAGDEATRHIRYQEDEAISRIVASWPGRFDISRAQGMGFIQDADFDAVIRSFIQNDMQGAQA